MNNILAIDEKILERLKDFCSQRGLNISKVTESIIEKFLRENE